MITRLSHTTVHVLDQDVALKFYRDQKGFEVRTDATMDNGFRWLTVGPKTQPDLVQPASVSMEVCGTPPDTFFVDKRIAGIYAAGFFVLLTIYFFLFMISASQTPGMKQRQLTVVMQDGSPLDPSRACMRGFGYLVSILPLMLGFLWAVIDPEHLTWADKVSGTFETVPDTTDV